MENKLALTINKCDKETLKKLGDNLRALRKSRGISQEGLSEMINRERSGLSGYERGTKTPTLYGMCDIANALNSDFKIIFEKRDGMSNMCRKNVFTEEFIKGFIENLDKEEIYESLITNYLESNNEEWQIVDFTEDRVYLKSDTNKYVKLTKVDIDEQISNERYCPIKIKYGSDDSPYFMEDRLFLDLQNEYTLTECYLIGEKILECFALEGMIQGAYELKCDSFKGMKNDFVDSQFLVESYYTIYTELKMDCYLSDKEILDIIKILDMQEAGSHFIDLLNSNQNEAIKFSKNFIKAYNNAIKSFVETGCIDEKILPKMIRLACMLRLEDHAATFLYKAHNEELEEVIAIGENEEFMSSLYAEIYDAIHYCRGYLMNMKHRNKDLDSEQTIIDVIRNFYDDASDAYIIDILNDGVEHMFMR